jgi:hypothetical protein
MLATTAVTDAAAEALSGPEGAQRALDRLCNEGYMIRAPGGYRVCTSSA